MSTPSTDFSHLPVTRLAVTLVPERAWSAPAHPGDLMRRALISGVYAAVPPHRQAAVLEGWFDARHGPNRVRPYALQVDMPQTPSPHDPVVLGLTLAGVLPDPRALLDGLQAMAAKGLGDARVPHTVAHIQAWGATVGPVDPQSGHGFPPPARLTDVLSRPDRPPERVRVHLTTPFTAAAWRDDARPEALCVGPGLLFSAAVQRLRLLQHALGLQPQRRWRAPEGWVESCALRWESTAVQGRRARTPQRLHGVVGSVTLGGPLHGLLPLLAFSQVLQIGRATSRGHGVVAVDWAPGD